jgi:hypothetical protein
MRLLDCSQTYSCYILKHYENNDSKKASPLTIKIINLKLNRNAFLDENDWRFRNDPYLNIAAALFVTVVRNI